MTIDYLKIIDEYCEANGAATIWRAWKEKMADQNREVRSELQVWPIPKIDQELDAAIANALLRDFLIWITQKHIFLAEVER